MREGNSDVIVSISAQEIYQHPDNPRKDLGDLSELADSIRKNGIMQNLTVIPGHWLTDEEWKGACAEYNKNPSEELRMLINEKWAPDGYTLIIGHRRFAASKMAGIESLPCRIIEGMDKKAQVSTMLAENMQRADLTIWEQANGFQMMLDLGETEEQIAEKSGFSKTTVRHRLNIARLDQKVLKEKEADAGFQLSLKDLYELEKVEDIAKRNKILSEARDSRDIVWRAQSAATEAARQKRADAIIKLMDKAGVKKAPEKYSQERWSGKWETVKEYSLDNNVPKSLRIPKKEESKLYYARCGSSLYLVKKAPKRNDTERDLARKEMDAKKKQIRSVMKEMDIRKQEFIGNVVSGKIAPIKEAAKIQAEIWNVLVSMGTYISMSNMRKFFTGKADYDCKPEEKEEADNKISGLNLEFQMMVTISYVLENASDTYDYFLHHNAGYCEKIKRAYAILERYGWSFTEEEKQILDGTHEFYVPEETE